MTAIVALRETAADEHPRPVRSLTGRALRIPLPAKLAGANLVVAAVATWAGFEMREAWRAGHSILVPALALIAVIAGSSALAVLALSPVRAIARTAERVRNGDLGARVPSSALAEEEVSNVAHTINALLDGVVADRERMRQLASQVIEAADHERASLARELHDSTAQSMAAVVMQLSALQRDAGDGALSAQIGALREIAQEAMEEVRTLAHTLHPRVLDDLGLAAALQTLARRVQGTTETRVSTDIIADNGLPTHIASVLYRVAQESMHNAVRHASATSMRVELTRGERSVRLEVIDDGRGFNVREAEQRRPGMGLFTMRERLVLAGGTLQIISAPNAGTRVVATVPLESLESNDAR